MLTKTSHLKGFVIRATDGELGTVDQFLFDDDTWCIRYLTKPAAGLAAGECLSRPSPQPIRTWKRDDWMWR